MSASTATASPAEPGPSSSATAGTSAGPSSSGAPIAAATGASGSGSGSAAGGPPSGPSPVASNPIRPVDSEASGISTSSVESSDGPLPEPTAGSLIAVAFHSLDPESKKHHIKPAVCTSSASLKDITSGASSSSSAAESTPAVTDAFNAAVDLVNFLDEQLSRPPSMGETFTSLVRPASKEMAARIHKAEKKIGRGHVQVPGKMSGWEGTRRVVGAEWNEFVKVFGKN